MRIPSMAILLYVVISLSKAAAGDPPAKPQGKVVKDDKEAVQSGIAYVETKSLAWLRQRKCASCHHVPFMVWIQRDARQRGFKIDEKGVQEATDHLLAEDNRAGIVPNPGEKEREGNGFSLMAAFTILAFRDGGQGPEPAAQKVMKKAAEHLIAKQQADGSWIRFEGRPPIMELQEAGTLLAAYSLGPEPKAEAASSRAKVRQWLAANSKGDNPQALSWRILMDHDRKASAQMLLKRQNADGGWSQTKEMASDAYATGQAIYALISRGGIGRTDPAIVKARDFLVMTQKPDGSWPMTSRPPNSGKGAPGGAGNLEPITAAGSAWAVLGLLQCTAPGRP